MDTRAEACVACSEREKELPNVTNGVCEETDGRYAGE